MALHASPCVAHSARNRNGVRREAFPYARGDNRKALPSISILLSKVSMFLRLFCANLEYQLAAIKYSRRKIRHVAQVEDRRKLSTGGIYFSYHPKLSDWVMIDYLPRVECGETDRWGLVDLGICRLWAPEAWLFFSKSIYSVHHPKNIIIPDKVVQILSA